VSDIDWKAEALEWRERARDWRAVARELNRRLAEPEVEPVAVSEAPPEPVVAQAECAEEGCTRLLPFHSLDTKCMDHRRLMIGRGVRK